MTVVKSILCIGDDKCSDGTHKWKIISTFNDEVDVSSLSTGCDVAVLLGDNLINHLKHPQNPVGMKRIIGGPAYTYGQNRASATLFFEGGLTSANAIPMKVSSYCEWGEPKEI